jgi:hypothetical protein
MRAARHASRARLVLLQGGRADGPVESTAREAAAWRALSERIGWSEEVAPLPDDYEVRLAEKIFGSDLLEAPLPGSRAWRPQETSGVVPRAVQPVWGDQVWSDRVWSDQVWGDGASDDAVSTDAVRAAPPAVAERRWLASSLVLVAAAAAAVLAWVTAREPTSPLPRPLEAVPASTAAPTPPPEGPDVDDPGGTSLASVQPVEDRVERPRRRGPERALATRTPSRGRARGPARATHEASSSTASGIDATNDSSRRTEPSADPSLALALLEHSPSVELGDDAPLAPPASSVDALEPWSLPIATTHRRETPVGWSLAPNRERWIGVSAASPGEMPAASGVGVVAQIDLASAIRF